MIDIDGEPWFVAKDVCNTLTIGNVTDATSNLDQIEVCTMRIPGQAGRAPKLVSESGLYKIIMRSDKPEAKAFQDWVTREVLPSIHKTGKYEAPAVKQEERPAPAVYAS